MKVDKSKWKKITFSEVCTIIHGKDHKTVNDPNGRYPIYGSGGIMGYATDYLCEPGTTIIGRKGTINSPIYVNEKFWNIDTAFGMYPQKNVFNKFFYYYCKNFDFTSIQSGAAIPSLTRKDILKQHFILPPLSEQQAIASELDTIQKIIDAYKAQLADLDVLAQSIFLDTFGKSNEWSSSKLVDVCNKITDGTHNPPQFTQDGIPFIFVSNIINNEITYNTQKFISEETYNELWKSTPVECGDIVYTSVGSYGNPAIVKSEKKFMFQRHIALIKPKNDIINSKYLKWFLISPLGRQQADDSAIGVAQKTLNLKVIKNFDVPIPPLNLQQQFAEQVEAIEQQKEQIRQQLADAETLMAERMQYYFS